MKKLEIKGLSKIFTFSEVGRPNYEAVRYPSSNIFCRVIGGKIQIHKANNSGNESKIGNGSGYEFSELVKPDDTPFSSIQEVVDWFDDNTGFNLGGGSSEGLTTAQIQALISDSINSNSFIAEGVMVDAFPAWEGDFSIGANATSVLSTGVDLNEVEEMTVHFGRNNDTWATISYSFDPSTIDFDILQGALLPHYSDSYLGIDNMSSVDFANGDIPFRAIPGGSGSFGFTVTKIEFKRRAVVEEGKTLIFDAPINSGDTNNNLSENWQEVISKYDGLQWSMLTNGIRYGGIIPLTGFQSGNNLGASMTAALHFILSGIDLSDSQFNFAITSHLQDADEFKLWGILPHGRVSNIANSTSYQKIGDVHIYDYGDGFVKMWGIDNPSSTANSTVAFPITMKNIEYDAQVTPLGTAYREAHLHTLGTASMIINRNNTATPVKWMVFGEKQ